MNDVLEPDIDLTDDNTYTDSVEETDSHTKKTPKKTTPKKTSKEEEIQIGVLSEKDPRKTIPETTIVEPPLPVVPAILKKTRNRKKINTKTIKRIQRFF